MPHAIGSRQYVYASTSSSVGSPAASCRKEASWTKSCAARAGESSEFPVKVSDVLALQVHRLQIVIGSPDDDEQEADTVADVIAQSLAVLLPQQSRVPAVSEDDPSPSRSYRYRSGVSSN